MGWFKEMYGESAHPKLPAKYFSRIYDEFGEKAAIDTVKDVQDGKVTVELLEKYLFKVHKKN